MEQLHISKFYSPVTCIMLRVYGGHVICHNETFQKLADEVKMSLANLVLMELIQEGFSGSYLVRNKYGIQVGIFKPKDEHPYAMKNPKTLPFLRNILIPQSFRRSNHIVEMSYISEVAAYLVDQCLNLQIVPVTGLVNLPVLQKNFDSNYQNMTASSKIGSLQLFVEGYVTAKQFYETEYQYLENSQYKRFVIEFQKMVILDYLIKNGDRHLNNWLVKTNQDNIKINEQLRDHSNYDILLDKFQSTKNGQQFNIKLAAIDNGATFPPTHSGSFRKFQFHWEDLEESKIPFDQNLSKSILLIIDGESGFKSDFVEHLLQKLENLFKIDQSFNKDIFAQQSQLFRGQIFNLVNALRNHLSPCQMINQMNFKIQKKIYQNGKYYYQYHQETKRMFF